MLDKKIVIFVVVALVVGLFSGYVVGYFGTNAPLLTQRINTLESQVDDLNSQLDVANSELDSSTLKISQLNTMMAQKNASISSLNIQLASLQTEKTVLTQQIYSLEAVITSLNAQLKTQVLGVYFSPYGGCEDQVRYWIGRANSTIHILIYVFTLDSVGDSIISAYKKGRDVKIVFERQYVNQYSEYQRLKAQGVSVRNDTNPELMHNKVMIIDGSIILTGSFNYSAAAEQDNNENLLIIKSTDLATTYEQEFQKIWNQSI